MSSRLPDEQRVLLGALKQQREHIIEALQGLEARDLRRPVLPSGWSCLGLVNHLSVDVERFWFEAVIAGDERAVEEVRASSSSAWEVSIDRPAEAVLMNYRDSIQQADEIAATCSFDDAPAWWPDFFGSWRLHSVREIVVHVITETAVHAGHLDAVRELVDGKLHLTLTD